jgi:hypothetical protein
LDFEELDLVLQLLALELEESGVQPLEVLQAVLERSQTLRHLPPRRIDGVTRSP